ncbi:MAG: acetolactate synthase small subunit [Anaerolineae bacterium]|nr:acetolactate synthase small subunit [Anaerolineae bacterium]
MKSTLVALVENKPGVLNRVVSLFRRRAFNMDSLTVGRTHRPDVSRMTIIMDTEHPGDAKKIIMHLYKLIDVIEVQNLTDQARINRDLALIKIRTTDAISRNNITEFTYRYGARIVDIGPDVTIVEITGEPDHVESFIRELEPMGIIEMARTGLVSMGRGVRSMKKADHESKRHTAALLSLQSNGNSNNGSTGG